MWSQPGSLASGGEGERFPPRLRLGTQELAPGLSLGFPWMLTSAAGERRRKPPIRHTSTGQILFFGVWGQSILYNFQLPSQMRSSQRKAPRVHQKMGWRPRPLVYYLT